MIRAGAASIPWRRKANRQDEDRYCAICEDPFVSGRSIAFTSKGQPVHLYRCWKYYVAALAAYYALDVPNIIETFQVSPRSAFRIKALAREL